jgi:hypothetical protein
MKIIQELSAHRQGGWQEQFNRINRWIDKFTYLEKSEEIAQDKSQEYFDTMYVCFQNMYILRDWLINTTSLTKEDLNKFIKDNKEIGICRDICNGTKHFNINNPSIDAEFGIIKGFNPLSSLNGLPTHYIIICAGGDQIKPLDLIKKSLELWETFISENSTKIAS